LAAYAPIAIELIDSHQEVTIAGLGGGQTCDRVLSLPRSLGFELEFLYQKYKLWAGRPQSP
jgi:hypothetical protein